MRLSILTTAASLSLVMLAAYCSKAPESPAKSKSTAGPPKEAVRQYLEENSPAGLKLISLDIDSNKSDSFAGHEVTFKVTLQTEHDFLSAVPKQQAFARRDLEMVSGEYGMPSCYEVATSKGTKFTGYGKLMAEWQIDRWAFQTLSYEGERPEGLAPSRITVDYVVLGTEKADQYFDDLMIKRRERAESLEALKSQTKELLSPGAKLAGLVTGSKTHSLELLIESGEENEQTLSQGFWSFRGTAIRDGIELPLEGSAWLNEKHDSPEVTVSLKARNRGSVHQYRITYIDGSFQPTEGIGYTIDLQPVK